MSTLIIRTSDRGSFKRCRRAWDYGSKIRRNLTAKGPAPKPLDFGTAIHAALEVYYDPEKWKWDREVVEAESISYFAEIQKDQLRTYLKAIDAPGLTSDELRKDFDERWTLGEGMLRNYFGHAKRVDTNWTPVYVELEFEVDITELVRQADPSWAGWQVYDTVVYQGRIDLVIQDENGHYWIVDHKTAARFDSTAHLELDPQCGSYAWAVQHMLGIPVAGVIYNELYKGVPAPPAELKRGGFSKNKSQDTTYELYVETLLAAYGDIPADYKEFLEYLKVKPNEYFRRTRVHRSPAELESLGKAVIQEALDMGDPGLRIYPNPTKFNCQNCMFRTPCLAENDGSDVDWILSQNYLVRD